MECTSTQQANAVQKYPNLKQNISGLYMETALFGMPCLGSAAVNPTTAATTAHRVRFHSQPEF